MPNHNYNSSFRSTKRGRGKNQRKKPHQSPSLGKCDSSQCHGKNQSTISNDDSDVAPYSIASIDANIDDGTAATENESLLMIQGCETPQDFVVCDDKESEQSDKIEPKFPVDLAFPDKGDSLSDKLDIANAESALCSETNQLLGKCDSMDTVEIGRILIKEKEQQEEQLDGIAHKTVYLESDTELQEMVDHNETCNNEIILTTKPECNGVIQNSANENIETLIETVIDGTSVKKEPKVVDKPEIKSRIHPILPDSHYLHPYFPQTRFLDSIIEESSDNDSSDKECQNKNTVSQHQVPSKSSAIPKNVNAIYPSEAVPDLSARRKHVSTLHKPKSDAIVEECVLVTSKFLIPEIVEEGCCKWKTEVYDKMIPEPESIYIESGSSSMSDLLDIDGETTIVQNNNDLQNFHEYCDSETVPSSDQELLDTSTTLSRQNSGSSISSSCISQSTVRFFGQDSLDLVDDCDNSLSETSTSDIMMSTESMRSLRELCLKQLSQMPYGQVVLEELANVSLTLKDYVELQSKDRVSSFAPSIPDRPQPNTIPDDVDFSPPVPPPPIPELPKNYTLPTISSIYFQEGGVDVDLEERTDKKHNQDSASHKTSPQLSSTINSNDSGEQECNNRLLAIIRESATEEDDSPPTQQFSESICADSLNDTQVSDRTSVGGNCDDKMECLDPRYMDNMFEAFNRRFSNLEFPTYTKDPSCGNVKRYSNIETSRSETQKIVENGKVVSSTSNKQSEKIVDGDDKGHDFKDLEKCIKNFESQLSNKNLNFDKPENSNKSESVFISEKKTIIEENTIDRVTSFDDTDKQTKINPNLKRFTHNISPQIINERLSEMRDQTIKSSENIVRPLSREEQICKGYLPGIVPRLSETDENLNKMYSEIQNEFDDQLNKLKRKTSEMYSRRSVIDSTPLTIHCTQRPRRMSLPKDLHEEQLKYIRRKEIELQRKMLQLEEDRLNLEKELNQEKKVRPKSDIPKMSEAEIFREQMHNEWMNKVAEREERRLHKIIKITKPTEEVENSDSKSEVLRPIKKLEPSTIEQEFLKRVTERRTKLRMCPDSDWESGAENLLEEGSRPKVREIEVKFLEGENETELKNLPKHLMEFAESYTLANSKPKTNDKEDPVEQPESRQLPGQKPTIANEVAIERESLSGHIQSNDTLHLNTAQRISSSKAMPMLLRSEVKENDQSNWYKQVYNTIHKQPSDEDFVTVRYKTRRGRPYKSSGYASEPEPNYDSDYCPRRSPLTTINQFSDKSSYGTLPTPIRPFYRINPGRIENYTPGHSSVSDRETKQETRINRAGEGHLSRAFKEKGYESDTSLVFRKKENSLNNSWNPDQQREVYKSVQAGGEPPLQGFRKPAPEKPKENTVVPPPPPIKGVSQFQGYQQYDEFDSPRRYVENNINIHYKSPTRHEVKETLPFEELQRRQAETMKQIYEQERQRKYLQELDDIAKRRHTDNFIPSQKSPISSTRFDDFAHREGTKVEPSRIVAKALYNFDGQSNKELSFKKGDIIYIRRQIDKNWYEGTHNANFGLLPVSYVEVISRDGTIIQQKPKSKDGLARAKYNFTAQSAIELSLNKGELVTLTRRVDENWYEGRIANRKGIIPVSYVEVISDIGEENRASPVTSQMSTISDTPPQRLSKTVKKTEILHVDTNSDPIAYRAIYRYRPQNTDELELQEGDIIFVLEKCDDGWFVGTSERTGCFGTFPGNYVEQI